MWPHVSYVSSWEFVVAIATEANVNDFFVSVDRFHHAGGAACSDFAVAFSPTPCSKGGAQPVKFKVTLLVLFHILPPVFIVSGISLYRRKGQGGE